MSTLSDRIIVPTPDSINTGLHAVSQSLMISKLGLPGHLTRDCSEPTGGFHQNVETKDVGPFRVTGYDFAVASLEQIFLEVKHAHPQVYNEVKTAGVLCVRHQRQNPAVFSNHSWGCAIDLYFGDAVVPQGVHKTHRGNLALYPYFHRHGWYWGAEFHGGSVDSMHFELSMEVINSLP